MNKLINEKVKKLTHQEMNESRNNSVKKCNVNNECVKELRNERLRVNRSRTHESRESQRTNQGIKMRKDDDALESKKEWREKKR